MFTSGYRAFMWGLIFVPYPSLALQILPHYLTIFLEGMGYVVALFAGLRVGIALFSKKNKGKWKYAYLLSLKEMCKIYSLVVLVLLGVAAWEAYEVIYLIM
jgi:hypothetical protein